MDIQTIKDLVSAQIAGQGTAVDAGGALAPILSGICDVLAGLAEDKTVFKISAWQSGDYTDEQFDEQFGEGKAAFLRANKNSITVLAIGDDDRFPLVRSVKYSSGLQMEFDAMNEDGFIIGKYEIQVHADQLILATS